MPSQETHPRAEQATTTTYSSTHGEDLQPTVDFVDYMKEYARQKPVMAALWCFGVGFILGWKLKPW